MKLDRAVIHALRVTPGEPAGLATRDPAARIAALRGDRTKGDRAEGDKSGADRSTDEGRSEADEELEGFTAELAAAQELLYASAGAAVLVILQAMDAAGKDGTIKHVMSGVNPQGCQVVSFKQPSAEEAGHDFLWRAARALPRRGSIGIFNRSYYEDVLVVKVHPELLAGQGRPDVDKPTAAFWERRYEDINAFERHLDRSGTRIVKFFLHVSKDEQRSRFLDRLDDPGKYWKFSAADLAERAHWDEYQAAYEQALSATSTPGAPWYVIPADHKHDMRALVAGILTHSIEQLDLRPPQVGAAQVEAIKEARAALGAS